MGFQAHIFVVKKKRAFAKYVDHVDDSRNISGTSRFLSGGIGGLTSQLCKYLPFWPGELLKVIVPSYIPCRNSQGGEQMATICETDYSPS